MGPIRLSNEVGFVFLKHVKLLFLPGFFVSDFRLRFPIPCARVPATRLRIVWVPQGLPPRLRYCF